ncbi:dihydrofolate reductase family protein [Pseudonocardia sp. TRM90224]|uniref:dihydrofolate reductase family protein n=1 Tax=Pseudonocardia sp. TRM90224 TaxID=2812678 RepID=UPI001E41E426|nr:dihydrofolate reductase family protein [Pseudonocardia sp. TRM90224]
MGSIRAGLFISLDGVTEAPDEWHFGWFNDEMGAAVGAQLAAADALLLGRLTYDGFAGYWPTADPADPMTVQFNEFRKYVVSTTLTDPTWNNSVVVSGDVRAELLALKETTNLGVTGSVALVRWMLQERLVDELHLMVHPVALGKGGKLFDDGTNVPLRLISSTAFTTGVVHLVYGPADEA